MIDVLKIAEYTETARDNIKYLTGLDVSVSAHLDCDSIYISAEWVNYACQRTFSLKTASMFSGGEIDYVWEQFEHLIRDVVVSKRGDA